MMSTKDNLTIRMDAEDREILELIADREYRSLAMQIRLFLDQGVNNYLTEHKLKVGEIPGGVLHLVPDDSVKT